MKFGYVLPTCQEGLDQPPAFGGPKELIEIAQMAEKLGFDSLWGNDHITPWETLRATHGQQPLNWYEILITMACCATATERIELGLGVIVMPFRDIVILAKQLATLDVFSGGRLLFGVGIGTVRDEFELLRPRQLKANRGAMLDESLEALRLLFTEPVASFSGRYYAFEKVNLYPKPIQKPLPLYISGRVEATLERVAKSATGLMTMAAPPDALRAKVNDLRTACEKEGRDVSEIDVTISAALSLDSTRERAIERFTNSAVGRRFAGRGSMDQFVSGNLIGTTNEVADRINQLGEAGLTHIAIQHVAADSYDVMKEQMQIFAEKVLPLCKSA